MTATITATSAEYLRGSRSVGLQAIHREELEAITANLCPMSAPVLQFLAPTRRPSTVKGYRCVLRRFHRCLMARHRHREPRSFRVPCLGQKLHERASIRHSVLLAGQLRRIRLCASMASSRLLGAR